MLIHSMLLRSAVNGPGERAVVWSKDVICSVAAALTQRAIPSIVLATSAWKKSRSRLPILVV